MYNLYKRMGMTLTATQLKQETYLLDSVKKEDIIITKRDRPFAVLVDFDRYVALTQGKKDNDKKIKALKSLGAYHLGGKSAGEIKAASDE